MLRVLLATLFALTSIVCSHAEEQAPAKIVRAVFWNIAWFPGGSPEATSREVVSQITKVMPALEKLRPDILGVSEVLNEPAMEIALLKTPGVATQVCSAFADDQGFVTSQQVGIASRIPATNAWWESWKTSRVTPTRGFAFAAIEPAPGVVFLVYSLHFKSNRGDQVENFAMREESTRQLLNHVAAMEKVYARVGHVAVILGGDFNTSLDDPRFDKERTLRDLKKAGFTWCWEGVPFENRVTLPTKPSNNPKFPPFPDTCFDHVFVKNVKIQSAKVETMPGDPSDHRPVVVELIVP